MGVTININGLSLCHRGSDGITIATAPDVCDTPPAPTPVPYPNIAYSSDLSGGTSTVSVDGGSSAAIRPSIFSKSTGDEPGTVGGVASGTFAKEASWLTFSADVFLEGQNACRLTDKMLHNHGNTINCAGEMQAPVAGGGAGGPDPCADLLQQIMDFIYRNKRETGDGGIHGLLHRFQEQINGANGPGTQGWNDHEKAIKDQQRGLRNRLKDWEDNDCGDPPPGAWRWATRPAPSPKEWVNPNPAPVAPAIRTEDVVVVGGAVAGGYLLYRVVRMLPSLAPPLWWTIPGNLAVP